MTEVKVLLAGLVAALTFGGLGGGDAQAANVPPLSDRGVLLAGDEAQPGGAATEGTTEDSAKMGKEEGTHTGPNLGATPENDTKKVDQPERRNPTTGGEGDDSKE